MRVAKLADKPTLSSEDIAFALAPRLNAAGRLGQAQLGVELLTTDSADRAEQLASYIDEFNQRRDSLERSVYLAANKQIKERFDARHDPAFVLSDAGWHAGVIGIVAGRLAEKYHRPVILISFDEVAARHGTGSGRSACGLDLHQALAYCGEHLLTHGGHAAAAGLRIEPAQVDRFREAFCNHASANISAADRIAEITIDAEAPLSQLTLRTIEQVEQIAPFGAGNPRPVLCATGVQVAAPPRHMGNGERHMSVQLAQHGTRLRAIGFGRGEWVGELNGIDRPLDIAYRPVINEFQGRRSVELHLVDWRLSTSPVARQPVASHSR
jgi:single-stranded-DNA-specific exonuclease